MFPERNEGGEPKADAMAIVVDSPLNDLLTGDGRVTFAEGDMQVNVGWLHTGGDGLVVTAHVDEGVAGRMRFWCDAQQWSEWIAPSLPVPAWDALPPAWQASAASLTLATASTDTCADTSASKDTGKGTSTGASASKGTGTSTSTSTSTSTGTSTGTGTGTGTGTSTSTGTGTSAGTSTGTNTGTSTGPNTGVSNGAGACDAETVASALTTSWPQGTGIVQASVDSAWRMGMVLTRDGRRLALQYLDGATSWLRERCRRGTPGDAPLDPRGLPDRRCVLAAGWAELPAALCGSQLDGGAVLLDVAADVMSGEYWLLDGEYAIAMRDGKPAGRNVVPHDLKTAALNDDAPRQVASPCVRLLAVIAEGQIPIPWLMAWRAGRSTVRDTSTASALAAGRVTLWRNGTPWARGRLLSFGDGCLAVQLDRVAANHAALEDEISGGDPMGVHSAAT